MIPLLIRALLLGLLSFSVTYAALRLFGNPVAKPPEIVGPPQPPAKRTVQGKVVQISDWADLIPHNWDQKKVYARAMGKVSDADLERITDEDPRMEMLTKRLRKAWDEAPARPQVDGQTVRLDGYVMPISDSVEGELSEFLLAPYLGTDIRLPPPPANQLVRVRASEPLPPDWVMMPVVVEGVLWVKKESSSSGVSNYVIDEGEVSAGRESPQDDDDAPDE